METQLLLAHDLRYLEDASALLGDVSEITRMINGVLRYVDRKIAADGTH